MAIVVLGVVGDRLILREDKQGAVQTSRVSGTRGITRLQVSSCFLQFLTEFLTEFVC